MLKKLIMTTSLFLLLQGVSAQSVENNTPPLNNQNHLTEIASYLSGFPDRERIVLYDLKNENLVDVTKVSCSFQDDVWVSADEDLFDSLMESTPFLTDAHNHYLTHEQALDYKLKKKTRKVIESMDKEAFQESLLNELPWYADMENIMWGDANNFYFHEEGNMEHLVFVTTGNDSVRVISYGITPQVQRELQKAVTIHKQMVMSEANKFDLTASVNNVYKIINNLSKEYNNILKDYFKDHCCPFEFKKCEASSFEELSDIINASGKFFIEDKGYVEIK